MTIANWITIASIIIATSVALFLAYKQGHFKKIRVHFSPSKFTEKLEFDFFEHEGKSIPAIGIMRFFTWERGGNFSGICSHIHLTIRNPTKYPIEDVQLLLKYPKKYFDDNDPHFFELGNPQQKSEKRYFTLIDSNTIQVVYTINVIHPKHGNCFIHPILQPMKDFGHPPDINLAPSLYLKNKGVTVFPIEYTITAKNLSKPIGGIFWIVSVLNFGYEEFFKKEKRFITELTHNTSQPLNIFEIHRINEYNQGKFKKSILVVKTENLNISYTHFPKIKSPFDNQWNFEKGK